MIPNKDIYVDADDKITDDPLKYAAQVAVAGVFLEDRVAKRYGISDELVSVDEPAAVRAVRSKPEKVEAKEEEEESDGGASVHIDRISDKEEAAEEAAPARPAAKQKGAKKK